MSDADINHFSVLLEQIVSQNKLVLEAVGDMQQKIAVLPLRIPYFTAGDCCHKPCLSRTEGPSSDFECGNEKTMFIKISAL